jgi:Domain of unknown function (DUF1929)/Bacterial Ig-like domain (group 2)
MSNSAITFFRERRAWKHLSLIGLALFGFTACQDDAQQATKLGLAGRSISISPNPASVNIGTSLQFAAIVRDKNNNLLNPQPNLRWTSSDPALASVEETDGTITGITAGPVTISVDGAGINSSIPVIVCTSGCQPQVAAISVLPNAASVVLGSQLLLNANAKNLAGDALNPQPGFQWSSSDPSTVSVNGAGAVVGLKIGTATVSASNGSIEGQTVVTVTKLGNSKAHIEGQWSGLKAWPTLAIHATVMPNGSLETWGWRRTDPFNKAKPSTLTDLWNPLTDEHKTTWETNIDLFGAGHELLEDGRLFVSSGSDPSLNEWIGINSNSLFTLPPSGGTAGWTAAKNMSIYRWYPSVTALPNGEVLVTGGSNEVQEGNYLHEVFTPSTNTWRTLTGAARRPGHPEVFAMPPYPFMHVAADGRVFYAGPTPWTAYLSTSGTGKWEDGEYAGQNAAQPELTRLYGSSVQFDEGKILTMGGSPVDAQADSGAVVLDMNKNGLATPTAAMSVPRRNLNATVLPDGTVLVNGGNDLNYDQGRLPKTAEVWDPSSGKWTVLAEQQVGRPYHSVGILLPDATVFTAGGYDGDKNSNLYERPGDPKQVKYRNAEIFSPPYLFKKDGSGERAARPQILNAPSSLLYKQAFNVNITGAVGIAKLNLIKLGSVTHAFNFGQRLVKLKFVQSAGTFTVKAPDNANLAPPGYYMLFAVDANGVPSVASMVQIKR